ncbi:unnamed protein product [Ambrosiozyma monospora]|uniref:Protein phosphatase n=1 Tax=Ambrosiozyma monospora TaxID=43982 RepID=A0A9W6YYT1_AMBMO|nr:unnamed protein product [Ambrosiozyma monospora]
MNFSTTLVTANATANTTTTSNTQTSTPFTPPKTPEQDLAEQTFRKFRSLRSGEHLHKSFKKHNQSFSISTAFYPKDRSKNGIMYDEEDGEFIKNYKHNLTNTAEEFIQPKSVYESPTGEDNYVIAHTDAGVVIGVLDGVGGWAEQGFDSSAISRELSNNITRLFLENGEQKLDTKQLLIDSFRKLQKEGKVKVGSTTACLGIVDGETGKLHAVNLGDSWFGVFRKVHDSYKCVYQSKEQTYYFNAPYQLSIVPQKFLELAKARKSKYLRNEPEEADSYEYQLESQDIVVFASDGLIDNLDNEAMEKIFNHAIMGPIHDDELAEINVDLLRRTVISSIDPGFKSVFSKTLTEITGQSYVGGKPDDITTVMLYVD